MQGDELALRWLAERLQETSLPISPYVRSTVGNVCAAILDQRLQLYKSFFELRYDLGSDGHGNHSAAVSLATGFQEVADSIAQAKTPLQFILLVRKLRRSFGEKLADKLKETSGKEAKFLEGEILVDIPPHNKDQIDGVFVLVDGNPRAIQTVSPVAHAVSDVFRLWVRRVRVFVAPTACERCRADGITASDIVKACDAVALGVGQLDLFAPLGSAATPSGP
jgi:hypothetical protein